MRRSRRTRSPTRSPGLGTQKYLLAARVRTGQRSSQTRALSLVWGGAGWGQHAYSTHRGGAGTGVRPARTTPITERPRARPLDLTNQRILSQFREWGEDFGKWTREPAQAVLSQVPRFLEGPSFSFCKMGHQRLQRTVLPRADPQKPQVFKGVLSAGRSALSRYHRPPPGAGSFSYQLSAR